MTFNKFAPLALGGVLIAGAMASASAAQQPAAAPAQAGPEGKRGPGAELRRPDPAAMAARRSDHLRAALQLRPDQEAALKAYVDAGQPKARPDRGERKNFAAMTTPQRLDARRAMMTERLAAFDQRAAATKRFYAQLNPSQQKAFDALQQQRGGRHGMHGGRGHGPRG